MSKVCTHTGTQWNDPVVSTQGALLCPGSTFQLTIGFNQAGVAVKVTSQGCPSFLRIIPGHKEKVQKLHHRAVNPQKLPLVTLTYEADCGWFPKCRPKGADFHRELHVTTWEQEGCEFQQ